MISSPMINNKTRACGENYRLIRLKVCDLPSPFYPQRTGIISEEFVDYKTERQLQIAVFPRFLYSLDHFIHSQVEQLIG